ncbi:MAG: UPF0146 family protein [Methanobacteriota archaeon]
MSGYKHIETAIAGFISGRYRSVAEIGTGYNTHAAELISRAGVNIFCTDLFIPSGIRIVPYVQCDVCTPDYFLFSGVESIFAIRPVEEMMDPLIHLATFINADLYVYHLGFEGYNYPHRIINCSVPLCQYVIHQN